MEQVLKFLHVVLLKQVMSSAPCVFICVAINSIRSHHVRENDALSHIGTKCSHVVVAYGGEGHW
jgi:hypothetical protein